jgi:hypothetical protein
MFITLDAAAGVPAGRQKSAADRACDQCKYVEEPDVHDALLIAVGFARYDVI